MGAVDAPLDTASGMSGFFGLYSVTYMTLRAFDRPSPMLSLFVRLRRYLPYFGHNIPHMAQFARFCGKCWNIVLSSTCSRRWTRKVHPRRSSGA